MTNLEKYDKAFIDAFNVAAEDLPNLKYQDIAAWDSVGHMSLMANIEDSFDIMMEVEDIMDFSSYAHGKEILKANYEVDIEA